MLEDIVSERINKNLFLIETDGIHILYSPIVRKAISIGGFKKQNFHDYANKLNSFAERANLKPDYEIPEKRIAPVAKAGLFLTSDCNLRCTYCYGNAGAKPININLSAAKRVVDLVAQNAIDEGKDPIVEFHGGGEPTYNWKALKETMYYMVKLEKQYAIKFNTLMSTNAVLNEHQVHWIAKYIKRLQISYDGTAQDTQRPLKNGGKSSTIVKQVMQKFSELGINFHVRLTATKYNIADLESIAFQIFSYKGKHRLSIEPVGKRDAGRKFDQKQLSVVPEEFVNKIVKLKDLFGNKINYSVDSSGVVRNKYCQAIHGRFIGLTPEGYLTTCYEVTTKSDPRSDVFFIGRYSDRSCNIEIDQTKIEKLYSMTADSYTYCQDCFAIYNCAGGCPSSAAESHPNVEKCFINKNLILDSIKKELKGDINDQKDSIEQR